MAWNYNQVILPSDCDSWDNKAEKTLATSTVSGLLSFSDKAKLDTIESGAQKNQEFASKAQAEEGTNTNRVMNPLRVKEAIQAIGQFLPLATQAQAETGTNNTTYMSPLRTKQLVDNTIPTIDNTKTLSSTPSTYKFGITTTFISGSITLSVMSGEITLSLVNVTLVTTKDTSSNCRQTISGYLDGNPQHQYSLSRQFTSGQWYQWSFVNGVNSYNVGDNSNLRNPTTKWIKDYMTSTSPTALHSAIADIPEATVNRKGMLPLRNTLLGHYDATRMNQSDLRNLLIEMIQNNTTSINKVVHLNNNNWYFNNVFSSSRGLDFHPSLNESMGRILKIEILNWVTVNNEATVQVYMWDGHVIRARIRPTAGGDIEVFGVASQPYVTITGESVYSTSTLLDVIHLGEIPGYTHITNRGGYLGKWVSGWNNFTVECYFNGEGTTYQLRTYMNGTRQVRSVPLGGTAWSNWTNL